MANITNFKIQENKSLKSFNTFGIDVKAQYFVETADIESLQQLLTNDQWQNMPKLILGGGSNVLLTQDFQGLVIKNNICGIKTIADTKEHVFLTIGAGENWHSFVMHCVDNQYAGVENLSYIPGTVGAAPMQNIGAYGVEIKEVFYELTAVNIKDGEQRIFTHNDCDFAYRNSVFKNSYKNKFIITDITLKLNKKPTFNTSYGALKEALKEMNVSKLSIKAISDTVIYIRKNKLPDPKNIGNAGSFFKNPEIQKKEFEQLQQKFPDMPFFHAQTEKIKIPAAWLIEQCGYKGKRYGDVGVHDKQALVLVNYGNGSGEAIKNLAMEIQKSVLDKFAIELVPEVNII